VAATGISGCNLAYFDMRQMQVFSVSNVTGLIWVSPAILSLLVCLSIFGLEIGQSASRDWNGSRSTNIAKNPRIVGKKERLASWVLTSLIGFERKSSPA